MNVTLTWTPPVLKPGQSAIKSYRVYARADGAPSFGLIGETDTTTLIDENVAAGTWEYEVTTVDVKDRESTPTPPISVDVTVEPDSVPPSPPTNLQASVA